MAQSLYDRASLAAESAEDGQPYLRVYAFELRRALLEVRDAAALLAVSEPIEKPDAAAVRLSSSKQRSDAAQSCSLEQLGSVIAYVLGGVVYGQSATIFHHFSQIYDVERAFVRGLDALVVSYPHVERIQT